MVVATLPTDTKNGVLCDLAYRIERSVADILAANERDLSAARDADIGDAKLRRLTLSDESIRQMAEGLRQIAEMDDPVGKVARQYTAPSGLDVRKVRCPLGVIMMIYEARPNVTIDAFALCFKAGNACILKGGREAGHSNEILANLAREALRAADVSQEAISLLVTSDREVIKRLLEMDEYIDLVIPRGGAPLIRFVHKHSTIPTVQHFHGVCHIFVDASADVDKALEICTTAKTSAPATCNAVEAILVHRELADAFVPRLVERFIGEGVEVRGDASVCALAADARPAGDEDWGCEFLDLIVAIRVVDDVASAIEHIHRHGSGHTESILTNDDANAAMFTERVQSSCTMVNASTRFNDGFQLGLGAEIGISTSKIHAYGPMGLEELTAQRYVVRGAWLSR
jgi:glutamate-5-semialdehyde dehydrogenase